MKAIKTKYIGPTNFKGARIKASDCDSNSITIPYPHELDSHQAHMLAAVKLCEKMQWPIKLIQGSLGNDYVHVFKP